MIPWSPYSRVFFFFWVLIELDFLNLIVAQFLARIGSHQLRHLLGRVWEICLPKHSLHLWQQRMHLLETNKLGRADPSSFFSGVLPLILVVFGTFYIFWHYRDTQQQNFPFLKMSVRKRRNNYPNLRYPRLTTVLVLFYFFYLPMSNSLSLICVSVWIPNSAVYISLS